MSEQPPDQASYREGYSTEDHLLSLILSSWSSAKKGIDALGFASLISGRLSTRCTRINQISFLPEQNPGVFFVLARGVKQGERPDQRTAVQCRHGSMCPQSYGKVAFFQQTTDGIVLRLRHRRPRGAAHEP
eukprot:9419841-Pyramimonas_sp.AAC.1